MATKFSPQDMGKSPALFYGGLGSIPGQIKWYLWWIRWQWSRVCPNTPNSLIILSLAPYNFVIDSVVQKQTNLTSLT
jgi:hypothetical protein